MRTVGLVLKHAEVEVVPENPEVEVVPEKKTKKGKTTKASDEMVPVPAPDEE